VPPRAVAGAARRRVVEADALLEALEEAVAGHKALVFSQWTGLLDRVEPR
jgi:SNF2 family DNA or RNA helicase